MINSSAGIPKNSLQCASSPHWGVKLRRQGVNLKRTLPPRRWGRALLLLSLFGLQARPALAQSFGNVGWMRSLANSSQSGEEEKDALRSFAFELHGLGELNFKPAPPLARQGWNARPGGEARLNLRLPNATELIVGLGWLANAADAGSSLRPSIGFGAAIPLGARVTLYGLATGGVWWNLKGESDAWGPSLALESRAACGLRVRIAPSISMLAELDLSTLSLGSTSGNSLSVNTNSSNQFQPVLGFHLGWALSPQNKKATPMAKKSSSRAAGRSSSLATYASTPAANSSSPELATAQVDTGKDAEDAPLSSPPLPHIDGE